MEKAIERVNKIKQGNPLEASTMIGAQASNDQLEKILSYIDIGKKEGAKLLAGGERIALEGELTKATTSSRPCSKATTRCASSRRRSSVRCSR